MNELLFGLFLLLSVGLAYKSYKDGLRAGAEKALHVLYTEKIICYDANGHIKPNPFFDHEPWVDVKKELN